MWNLTTLAVADQDCCFSLFILVFRTSGTWQRASYSLWNGNSWRPQTSAFTVRTCTLNKLIINKSSGQSFWVLHRHRIIEMIKLSSFCSNSRTHSPPISSSEYPLKSNTSYGQYPPPLQTSPHTHIICKPIMGSEPRWNLNKKLDLPNAPNTGNSILLNRCNISKSVWQWGFMYQHFLKHYRYTAH